MARILPRQRADRRQLQQIIAGLTEGVILIEPDATIIWANAAALAMHGVRELAELGANISEFRERFELRYRNHHRLAAAEYPMDRLTAGEEFRDVTVDVIRTGQKDAHWVHQIRSLVLTDAAGDPDCLALVIHDATERFSAEERFERTFAANPAPAIICRLADLRYVKVNQGFLEMTACAREDVIGRSVYEIDVLEQAENKALAVERLQQGRTIPQMEALLRLPDGQSKYVIVAGHPIEMGDEACMLFTFMDLDPRKRAEDALRQSEARFSRAFRLAPVPASVSTLAGFQLLDVNDAFLAATGYIADAVIGHRAADIRLWENAAVGRRFEQELAKAGSVCNREMQMRTKDGEVIDCLVSADSIVINDERCVLCVMQDITERKRSEEELIAAIEAVMQDASWFSRSVIEKLANARQPRGPGAAAELADLTPREREILGLICRGLSNEQIAERLSVSRNTIRNHVATIYGKIDVHRRSAAIIWARDRGFSGETALHAGAVRRRSRSKHTRSSG